jgi:hypothetical protein
MTDNINKTETEKLVSNTINAQVNHVQNLKDSVFHDALKDMPGPYDPKSMSELRRIHLSQPKNNREKGKTIDEMINAKVSIAYTHESEVKVFNLDTESIINYLDARYEKAKPDTQMTCVYRIQMWKSAHAKVKLIIYKDAVYMQTKKSLDKDGIKSKVKLEETVKIKSIEQTIRDLKFFGFKLIFDGVKDRTTWIVDKNVVVTYDKWVGGQLAGVDYFEIENSHETIEIDYEMFVNNMLSNINSTRPYHISTKGTWTLYKLYRLTYLKSWAEGDEISFSEWIVVNPPVNKIKHADELAMDVKSSTDIVEPISETQLLVSDKVDIPVSTGIVDNSVIPVEGSTAYDPFVFIPPNGSYITRVAKAIRNILK